MSPKLAVILGLVLLVVIGFAFHWWILDVRRIWDWLVYAEPEPADLPGPDRTPAPWAGEHHPTAQIRTSAPTAAEIEFAKQRHGYIPELSEVPSEPETHPFITEWRSDDPVTRVPDEDFDWLVASLDQPALSYEERLWARLEFISALGWDARQQAARCWEILHVEFPRLRAELCGVAA